MISYQEVVSNKAKKDKIKKNPNQFLANFKKILIQKNLQVATLGILLGIITITALPYLIEANFKNKIIGKVYVANSNLSGRSFTDAGEIIQREAAHINTRPIQVLNEQKSWSFYPGELGFRIDERATLAKIKGLGRSGSILERLTSQIKLLFGPQQTNFVVEGNKEAFLNGLLKVTSEVEIAPINAGYQLKNKSIILTDEKQGKKVDTTSLYNGIEQNLSSGKNGPLFLVVFDQEPQVTKKEAQIFLPEVSQISNFNLSLAFKDQNFKIDPVDLVKSITLTKTGQFNFADLNLASGSAKEQKLGYFRLTLDQKRFMKTFEPIAKEIETPPVNAKFTIEGGRVVVFEPSKDGVVIKREQLVSEISNWLNSDLSSKTIEIAANVTLAEITTAQVNNLGIKELVGKGTSNFSGSSSERIHNIKTATSKINGTLIKPSETFSFNQTVGEISLSTGYTNAYVISKGRTVLGEGGGVCQVSTTTFRAALNSGLPFVERNAHAYRVGYYEKDSPPGFDATIYVPTVDLKFKNDTPAHILIKAYVSGNNLNFEFYGTDDGRKVEIDKPIITNVAPAPEPAYEDDPELPAGQLKQVDFAAPGANVKIIRRVTLNGQTTSDSFFSAYKPWQAVYKRGTKPI